MLGRRSCSFLLGQTAYFPGRSVRFRECKFMCLDEIPCAMELVTVWLCNLNKLESLTAGIKFHQHSPAQKNLAVSMAEDFQKPHGVEPNHTVGMGSNRWPLEISGFPGFPKVFQVCLGSKTPFWTKKKCFRTWEKPSPRCGYGPYFLAENLKVDHF